jgi:hypothetical protein
VKKGMNEREKGKEEVASDFNGGRKRKWHVR